MRFPGHRNIQLQRLCKVKDRLHSLAGKFFAEIAGYHFFIPGDCSGGEKSRRAKTVIYRLYS
jgi:hypothetical protein